MFTPTNHCSFLFTNYASIRQYISECLIWLGAVRFDLDFDWAI